MTTWFPFLLLPLSLFVWSISYYIYNLSLEPLIGSNIQIPQEKQPLSWNNLYNSQQHEKQQEQYEEMIFTENKDRSEGDTVVMGNKPDKLFFFVQVSLPLSKYFKSKREISYIYLLILLKVVRFIITQKQQLRYLLFVLLIRYPIYIYLDFHL